MSSERTLTHFDESGRARMVDVGDKAVTARRAVATGRVDMQPETIELIRTNRIKKGDPLAVAQVAGIMARQADARAGADVPPAVADQGRSGA